MNTKWNYEIRNMSNTIFDVIQTKTKIPPIIHNSCTIHAQKSQQANACFLILPIFFYLVYYWLC